MAKPKLQERDWLTLLHGVHELYEQKDPASLAQTMLDVTRRLIPCDHASYDEVDLIDQTTSGICTDPAVDAQWPALQEAASAHFHEHPVLHFFKEHPEAGPRRISDFLPGGQFHETGLYRDCYRYIGVDHQLVTRLPGEQTLEIGIALSRSGLDFSSRDRLCLELLQPHLQQAHRQCLTNLRLNAMVASMTAAMDALPQSMIVLDTNAHVVVGTPRAKELLARYFPDEPRPVSRIPLLVQQWLRDLLNPAAHAAEAVEPLVVENDSGHIAFTVVGQPTPETWVLLLKETSQQQALQQLRDLGLTRRQSQVLYWVAQGKTNSEIACLLGMSTRTVQKHLEHVFKALNVDTRTLASVKAMETINDWSD